MNIAVVGTGGIAQAHLRTLTKEPDVEIVGHVSRTPQKGAEAAQVWGGRAYTSVQDLLAEERVDAAWITTPPHVHGEIENAFIDAGVPFFVEKPLAAERETAAEIAAAVAKRGLVTAVGYNWRAMDTLPEVRDTLKVCPPRLILGAWHDTTPPPLWWHRQNESGGQMVEQATHLFDAARYLAGEAEVVAATADHHVRSAYPELDVATVSTALLAFAQGARGVFTATCLLKGPADVSLRFVCEGLVITLTRDSVVYDTGLERREVKRKTNPTKIENRAFLDAVTQHDPALVFSSYADALLTHRLCFAVLEGSL